MRSAAFDVSYVAHLARIEVTPEEAAVLGPQLSQILAYVEKLQQLDVSSVEPMAHPIPLTNVTRSDEVLPSLAPDDALRNAPAQRNGLFLVPKIVE